MTKKLDKIYQNSKRTVIDDNTKLVIMSDCHRGSGDNFDNFLKNQNIFKAALNYYYKRGFTYIELGDGDDLWEVKDSKSIIEIHLDTFKLIKKFYDDDKLIMVYGNHDLSKKNVETLEKYFYKYYDKDKKKEESLLDGLVVYESLILEYDNHDIFLIHGHQVDFLNGTIWWFSKFLVRYMWRILEFGGVSDPTGSAKNNEIIRRVERKLENWSIKNNKILIAGHTHRAIFPKIGHSLYFNDGSCIHPNGITCLEIENGHITLINWVFEVNDEGAIYVKRKVLEGSEKILKFFKQYCI